MSGIKGFRANLSVEKGEEGIPTLAKAMRDYTS
jgi:hypothetical protein